MAAARRGEPCVARVLSVPDACGWWAGACGSACSDSAADPDPASPAAKPAAAAVGDAESGGAALLPPALALTPAVPFAAGLALEPEGEGSSETISIGSDGIDERRAVGVRDFSARPPCSGVRKPRSAECPAPGRGSWPCGAGFGSAGCVWGGSLWSGGVDDGPDVATFGGTSAATGSTDASHAASGSGCGGGAVAAAAAGIAAPAVVEGTCGDAEQLEPMSRSSGTRGTEGGRPVTLDVDMPLDLAAQNSHPRFHLIHGFAVKYRAGFGTRL